VGEDVGRDVTAADGALGREARVGRLERDTLDAHKTKNMRARELDWVDAGLEANRTFPDTRPLSRRLRLDHSLLLLLLGPPRTSTRARHLKPQAGTLLRIQILTGVNRQWTI
jgi:hypothetical protein